MTEILPKGKIVYAWPTYRAYIGVWCGYVSGHVLLSVLFFGYPGRSSIFMCDLGCDGFPSLDLVGNPTTQVGILFMYLLL